jgi:DNA-binding NtrC family response regulator
MSRCLIVSDDPTQRTAMREACSGIDADPAEAEDALVARRMVATLWPDLVLTGGVGPGVSWLKTLPQLWEEVTELPGGGAAPAGVRAFVHGGGQAR